MFLQRTYKKSMLRASATVRYIYLGGFTASQADIEAYDPAGAFKRLAQPYAGRIVRTTVQTSSARTAGTLTITPTRNGTKLTATGLTLTLSETNTLKHYRSVSAFAEGYTFAAGDEIGAMLTSDGDWANGSGDLQITYYLVYDHSAEG